MLTRPCCCGYEMRIKEIGAEVVEMAGADPYQLWLADELECRKCGRTILYGFGHGPVAHRPSPELAEALQRGARIIYERTQAEMATEVRVEWAQICARTAGHVRS